MAGSATDATGAAELPLRQQPFLRVPPFPGVRLRAFTSFGHVETPSDDVVAELKRLRVGGTYWASQPALPAGRVVVRSTAAFAASGKRLPPQGLVFWPRDGRPSDHPTEAINLEGDCDPWHVLSDAVAVVLDEDDELRVIAAILGVPAYFRDVATGVVERDSGTAIDLLRVGGLAHSYENPFTGARMAVGEAIQLCGFWRDLIDRNRSIASGLGFAFWKQAHVAPLLWNGTEDFPFLKNAGQALPGAPMAVWRSKVPPKDLAALERAKVPVVEVEDGFLRSQGLGADCIPPLSITVDELGAYFDPAQPSELERLLEEGEFDVALLDRARRLRELIVKVGLGKYERDGGAAIQRKAPNRRYILVPGQVEDDRSVLSGGCGLVSNLELLRSVRAFAPDAYVVYKPHPDVIAGHRRGEIADRISGRLADEIVTDASISKLIDMVDEVHVNTSLAGFEALMRGRPVTTYGVPFYAGWGLTNDLGPVPRRRTARRTLDELVAATLILYPRYLDPVTGLPCPAETIVDRLSRGAVESAGPLVTLRRLQGRLMRSFRSLVA